MPTGLRRRELDTPIRDAYPVFCILHLYQRPADMTRGEPVSHLTHSFVPLCAAACFGEFYTGHATRGARGCEAGFVSAPAVDNDGGFGCCQAVGFEGGRLHSSVPPGTGGILDRTTRQRRRQRSPVASGRLLTFLDADCASPTNRFR